MSVQIKTIRAIEALMLDKFTTEPFHNFHLLYGRPNTKPLIGGTCSDKTLSFINAARQAGFDAHLHSAFIGGKEIHRLARIHINDHTFYADVGNGWPALQLYPAHQETTFQCFGMEFRSEIYNDHVKVYHTRNNTESLQLEVPLRIRPESDILKDINQRFSSGIQYPFSRTLRFSLIVGQRFLFLRGDQLQIYSENEYKTVDGITSQQVHSTIRKHFGFDTTRLIAKAPVSA